jgi:hypothetical protein
MDVIDEKKLKDVVIDPAVNRLVNEVVKPVLAAVARVEALLARVNGAQVTVKLGPEAESQGGDPK